MYMPGRLRTASSPSSTVMALASYVAPTASRRCGRSATVPSVTASTAAATTAPSSVPPANAVDSDGAGWLGWRLGCSATGRNTPGVGEDGAAATGPRRLRPEHRRSPPFLLLVYLPDALPTRSPQPLRPCLRPVHTLLRLPVRPWGRQGPAGRSGGCPSRCLTRRPERAAVGTRRDPQRGAHLLPQGRARAEARIAGHPVDAEVGGLEQVPCPLDPLLGDPPARAQPGLVPEPPGERAHAHPSVP